MQRSDEISLERETEAASQESSSGGRLGAVRRRVAGLFSIRAFLLALALTVSGMVVGGAVPLLGAVGRFVGLFLAGFALGLLSDRRRYLETGIAGAFAAGAGFLASALGTVLFPVVADYGVEIAGVGATAGLLVAVAGHYFGRDLRRGLTRDL